MDRPAFEVDLAVLLAHPHPSMDGQKEVRQELFKSVPDGSAKADLFRVGQNGCANPVYSHNISGSCLTIKNWRSHVKRGSPTLPDGSGRRCEFRFQATTLGHMSPMLGRLQSHYPWLSKR
jgi:hypothetical protein